MHCIRSSQDTKNAVQYALLILPAIALGALAMILGGISPALWGQQIAAWALLSLLTPPLCRAAGRLCAPAWSILFLIVLSATLLGTAVDGARRWLDLGIFNAYAAMLVLPAMLAVLHSAKYPHPYILAAALVLCLQPDLSQLTALAAASLPLIVQHREKRRLALTSLVILCLLEIRCIGTAVSLPPVSYSEGILALLGEASRPLQAAGYLALAAIPAGFVYRHLRKGSVYWLSIALYYTVSILFSLSGEYPVPFMGFGLSPIAGYYLACICAPSEEL